MTTDHGRPPQSAPTADLADAEYTVRDRARLALCYSAYKLALAARSLVATEDDWWANPGHYVAEARKLSAIADEVMERAVIVERESGTRWSAIAGERSGGGGREAMMREWAAADRVWRAAVEAHVPVDRAARTDDAVASALSELPEGAAAGMPNLPGGATDPAGAAAILDAWFVQTAPPGSRLAARSLSQRPARGRGVVDAPNGVLPIPGQPKPGRVPYRQQTRVRVRPITDGLATARARDRGIADRRLKAAIEDVLIAAAPLTELAAVPPELVHLAGPLRALIDAKAANVGHVRLRRAAFELVCAPLVPLDRFPAELDDFAAALAVLRHAIERV